MTKFTDDDYCDIYGKKICDNCGKCLEAGGVDIKAIKIEDIAKTVEENTILEEEYKSELEAEKESMNEENPLTSLEQLKDAYDEFKTETGFDFSEEDYEDAFDHIEDLEGVDLFDEEALKELTEEVFPGVRKLKSK
jgi:Fe-S-cluster containining protein